MAQSLKPWLSIEHQVNQIPSRGMEIENRDQANHALETIGYYRLSGYEDTLKLLATLDSSSDACVIVDHVNVSDAVDADEGLSVRAEVLGNLLIALHRAEVPMHGPVQLAVGEENRRARVNNFDRATRKALIDKGSLPKTVGLMHASPGSEHLLWLPDVVCSAYRQEELGRDSDLFDEIRDLTHVRKLS